MYQKQRFNAADALALCIESSDSIQRMRLRYVSKATIQCSGCACAVHWKYPLRASKAPARFIETSGA